jgi:beta-glucanase (GH16 family)
VSNGWGAPVLSDDFTGTRLDTAKWQVYNDPSASSHPGTTAGVSVGGGLLKLVGGLYGGKEESAGIISNLGQTFGRWEARIRADPGDGYSATAFLWPTQQGSPEWTEIDFAEILDPTRQVGTLFLHHGQNDQQLAKQVHTDFTGWHTVAVDWLPDHITYYVDGKVVWTYHGSFVPQKAFMQLYLRDEVQPGYVRKAGTPQHTAMDVDWVHVYRAPGH